MSLVKTVKFPLIQQMREKLGLTHKGLAQKCGVPAETLERYEQGILDTEVYFNTLCRICRTLGFSARRLFE